MVAYSFKKRFGPPILAGKRGDVLCWADLPPDARAVWARVERACQMAARAEGTDRG